MCACCCHWSAPLSIAVRVGEPALRYEQWLAYHYHVVLHQGGALAMVA
jgi:hypothetical protein